MKTESPTDEPPVCGSAPSAVSAVTFAFPDIPRYSRCENVRISQRYQGCIRHARTSDSCRRSPARSSGRAWGRCRGMPAHQRIGRKGEEEAYFCLRKLGYVMVARSYRTARRRGEIDLIGCDHDVLCCIEVTTRTSHAVKPGRAAVDRDKQPKRAGMGRE